MYHPKGPTFLELMQQALSSTTKGYDLLASKFDYTPFRTPDALLDRIAPHLGAPGSVARALDVCCGTGAGMRVLRPIARDLVVGADFSRGMMEEASTHVPSWEGAAKVAFVQADARALPFRRAFGLATCFGANGHIPVTDEQAFLRSVAQSLEMGGRFVFLSARMPPVWSRSYLVSRGFNAVMHARNLVLKPPFVMFYLTFLLPEVKRQLEVEGFEVEIREGLFEPPFSAAILVVATRVR
ncbi:MAG: class I SAM-dependent methyltransferase [Deltaproteobacteria bacterium]|nr:class I SAM-dependent methyltransferase [Deltaproteobacteria bacterium]